MLGFAASQMFNSVIAGPPVTYPTWDPSRTPMVGSVVLSSGNAVATLSSDGSSFFGTVALTNYFDISDANGRYMELELVRGSGFVGIGVSSATARMNATRGYLGEDSVQLCLWEDASWDSSGELTIVNNNRPTYGLYSRFKIYTKSGHYWFGVVGHGWWNPTTLVYDNVTTPTGSHILEGFPGGGLLYSIAASCAGSSIIVTEHCNPAEWLDAAPTGAGPYTT